MVTLISSAGKRNDLFSSEQHEALVRHLSVPRKHELKNENRSLLELGGPLPEVRVIEPVFYLRLGSRPQMVADEVRVKRTEKVQRPDGPVFHLRVTIMLGFLCFLWFPFNNILFLLNHLIGTRPKVIRKILRLVVSLKQEIKTICKILSISYRCYIQFQRKPGR